MRTSFFANPFAFFGLKHADEKTEALFNLEDNELCATDLEGKPQAFFKLPVTPNKKVLGVPRSEGKG